jgi:hypothetical protein
MDKPAEVPMAEEEDSGAGRRPPSRCSRKAYSIKLSKKADGQRRNRRVRGKDPVKEFVAQVLEGS